MEKETQVEKQHFVGAKRNLSIIWSTEEWSATSLAF